MLIAVAVFSTVAVYCKSLFSGRIILNMVNRRVLFALDVFYGCRLSFLGSLATFVL